MTLKLINWPSFDLHVVLGVPSAELGFVWDDTSSSLPSASSSPPPNAQLTLTPGFQPEGPPAGVTVSGHGVSVDTQTGVVTVLAPPSGGRRLHNFLLTASLTDTAKHETTTQVTRIHVHDGISRAWLTPSRRTVQPEAFHTFSLLAEFDDGVIGDIGNWPGLQWSTDPPSAALPATSDIQLIHAESGAVIARTPGAHARVIVEHAMLAHPVEAEITCTGDWATPRELTWIAGRDPAKWRETTNVLFLPEGFTDGEEELFMTLVRNIVRKLRAPTLRPYDLLYDTMNYWAVFVASPEPGFSIRCEVYTSGDPGGVMAVPMPIALAPAPVAASWSLAELLYRVGLPIKADATRALAGDDGLLEMWKRVYDPTLTESRVAQWKDWRLLASRMLVNDRNTVFEVTAASRPRMQGGTDILLPQAPGIDEILTRLRYRGEAVGETWRAPTPSGPAPKDHRLVCFLVRSRLGRSANTGEYFTSTLAKRLGHLVRPAAAGGFEIVPVRLKRKAEPMLAAEKDQPYVDVDDPPTEGVAVVAHEMGHSLGLGDEYADYDKRDLPAGSTLSEYGNIQEAPNVLAPDTQKLQSSRIKWGSWHRIQAAGVLAQDPDPARIAQDYRLTLRPGHASAFRENDLVRLRRRPLFPDTLVSDVLRVKKTPAANEAHLDVTVLFSGWTSPGFFKAGSVLMKMLRWPFRGLGLNLGDELLLMARIIREHLDSSQLPLNARPGRALAACEPDADGRQSARNLPDGLPKCQPRNRSRIVGLFEGGRTYHCGAYHPTGACVMRTEMMSNEQIPFCPVCRYIMVDLVDPTKHGIIDRDYGGIYPDPRL